MYIAICDDDSKELLRTSTLLDTYRQERNVYLIYKTYLNSTELLFSMEKNPYDVLLLDILMPGFTGIEAAKEIRTFDQLVKIVFLTSSPEFALESYGVKAKDYILKPISKDKLFSILDDIFKQDEKATEGISIKTQGGLFQIPYSKTVFVEVMNKRLYFHLSDGAVREVYAPLSKYEDLFLRRREFIKVNRSYIVNLWHMEEITKNGFKTASHALIPISRLLYSGVRKTYMEHLFAKESVE